MGPELLNQQRAVFTLVVRRIRRRGVNRSSLIPGLHGDGISRLVGRPFDTPL
jgi:hypothetical protein